MRDESEAIVAEQVAWWRARNWTACEAWDAMGGSTIKLIVTWDDVRLLALSHLRPPVPKVLGRRNIYEPMHVG